MTTTRTVADRMAAVRRQIRALSREPDDWDITDLLEIGRAEQELATLRTAVVYALRNNGYTDGAIADTLNISRQAVSKRWPGGGFFVGAAGRYRKSLDLHSQPED